MFLNVKNFKSMILVIFKISKFQFVHVTPSNFACLIVKTASPGPIVSVPTLGSWKYDDLICKIPKNPPGGIFSSVYGTTTTTYYYYYCHTFLKQNPDLLK